MLYTKYKQALNQLVGFQTVSTDPRFKPQIEKAAGWLCDFFDRHDFTVKKITDRQTNPLVLAQYHISDQAKTILVYGHYDVQPVSNPGQWYADPFKIFQKQGKLFARGIADNKGQTLIHIVSAMQLITKSQLAYNVVFLIEGNEESGNPAIQKHLNRLKKNITPDHIVISDGAMLDDHPTLDISLRGSFNAHLTLKTAASALHSGIFGGAVPNAAHELSLLLSKLLNRQKKGTQIVKRTRDKALIQSGIKKISLTKGNTLHSQVGTNPTIQITGLQSGYTGSGFASIIPHQAEVKLNFRTTPAQKAAKIQEEFSDFLKKNIPDYVDYDLIFTEAIPAVSLDTNSDFVKLVKTKLRKVYRQNIKLHPVGGSLPIVTNFIDTFGIQPTLISLCNSDCNMHGSNENFDISLIKKGLEFSSQLFGDFRSSKNKES